MEARGGGHMLAACQGAHYARINRAPPPSSSSDGEKRL